MSGRPEDDEMFVGFTSFTYPPASFRFDFTARTLEPSPVRIGNATGSDAPVVATDYRITQVWFPSKDGTRVSMFLVHRADCRATAPAGAADRLRRLQHQPDAGLRSGELRAGSSRRDLSRSPTCAAAASTARHGTRPACSNEAECLRRLHRRGRVADQQPVTSTPGRLAIEGGSNGGLLVGASWCSGRSSSARSSATCRCSTCSATICSPSAVSGSPEYGSRTIPTQFAHPLRTRRYHKVKDGVAYPPSLITTADTDDRVSHPDGEEIRGPPPGRRRGRPPILLRVETKAGHGAGKPVSKMIDEDADIFAFLFKYLEIE